MYPSTNHVTYRIHEPVELHCGECTSLNKRQVRSNAAIHTDHMGRRKLEVKQRPAPRA